MKATGNLIYSMVQVKKFGLMDQGIKEITLMERNSEKERMYGLMEVHTTATGMRTGSKATVPTHGWTAESTWVSGRTTTCTATDCTFGRMADGMKATTSLIRSTALGSTSGLTAESTKGTGRTGSSTVRGDTSSQTARCELECGRQGNERSGSTSRAHSLQMRTHFTESSHEESTRSSAVTSDIDIQIQN